MTTNLIDPTSLLNEYETLIADLPKGEFDRRELCDRLVRECDWTTSGASALVELATSYGAFMLRNALALAVALEIEDGDLRH
jgi:hypothetical protein